MPETLDMARRLLREYGDRAEEECDSRASYHEMQGDEDAAEQWRRLRTAVQLLRQREGG
jgi:plasmid stabilization system protein ParE